MQFFKTAPPPLEKKKNLNQNKHTQKGLSCPLFLKRAGGIILVTTVVLWALASFPQAGPGQKQSEVSIAGRIASGIEVVVRPIGFNHDIALALLPSMAAREIRSQ